MNFSRQNNFDLIRLLAALQVVIIHTKSHLEIRNTYLNIFASDLLSFFPGVPVFFFVSGFLVYASFERHNDNIRQFYKNRFLRIYPALWACFFLTLVLLLLDYKGEQLVLMTSKEMTFWLLGQLSFFQFFTPDQLRYWGVGTPNGSLWTITVELQFYVMVPLLFFLLRHSSRKWLIYMALFSCSMAFNLFLGPLKQAGSMIGKLGAVSVLPYLYYFLIGILAVSFWDRINKYFEQKFIYWISAYLFFVYVFSFFFQYDTTSYWISTPVNLLADFFLAGVVLSFAFSLPSLSERLLRGNDVSYGIYIYHMVVVNFLIQRGYKGNEYYFAIALGSTILLAWLSWKYIEKPALKLKHVRSMTPNHFGTKHQEEPE